MKRALGLALLIAALAPAAAGAAVPGPTILDFEDQENGARVGFSGPGGVYANRIDVVLTDGDGCGTVNSPGGNFGPKFLEGLCEPFRMTFASGQATVMAYVKSVPFGTGSFTPAVSATAYDAQNQIVASNSVADATNWTSLVIRTSDGATSIRRIDFFDDSQTSLSIDDIGYSPTAQPDVDITDGPAGTVASGDATFTFAGNQPGMTFTCQLDGRAPESCSSPVSYGGLSSGDHTFTVY